MPRTLPVLANLIAEPDVIRTTPVNHRKLRLKLVHRTGAVTWFTRRGAVATFQLAEARYAADLLLDRQPELKAIVGVDQYDLEQFKKERT